VQEILDRLARRGLVLYPYFITVEERVPESATTKDERLSIRWLLPEDAQAMARVSVQEPDLRALQARMRSNRCLGAFWDGDLAAFSWMSTSHVPIPGSGSRVLFPLNPTESYLFDMYVAPQYRGLRLAGRLRAEMYSLLAAEGRTRHYSITLAFNRSSRRFKARLGAREAELRVYVQARAGNSSGLDVRVWSTGERLRTARIRRVPPLPKNHPLD